MAAFSKEPASLVDVESSTFSSYTIMLEKLPETGDELRIPTSATTLSIAAETGFTRESTCSKRSTSSGSDSCSAPSPAAVDEAKGWLMLSAELSSTPEARGAVAGAATVMCDDDAPAAQGARRPRSRLFSTTSPPSVPRMVSMQR